MNPILIKYGGAAMTDPAVASRLMGELTQLGREGLRLVLVHGGGKEIDKMLGRLGIESERIQGLRVTGPEVIEATEMVLAGSVNKRLAALVNAAGGRAVGISGRDASLFIAEKKTLEDADLGYVGTITKTDPALILSLLNGGFLPIVCPIADDGAGQPFNINADEAAASLAVALKASKVILLSDIPGVMENYPDPASVIPRLHADDIERLAASGRIDKGMIPKLRAALDMAKRGVAAVQIIDGRNPSLLRSAVTGGTEIGTTICL